MDNPAVSQTELDAFHADLTRLNRILGNDAHIAKLVQRDMPGSVLDIGCGQGSLLAHLRDTLGVQVRGVELRLSNSSATGVLVTVADATQDPLPECDLALCLLMVHHLDEAQVVNLIRNVGRSCRRFLIVDLVRHPLPLALFTLFMWPLMSKPVHVDGMQSIRRAYTPDELRTLVVRAIAGTASTLYSVGQPNLRKAVDRDYLSRLGPRGG